MPDIEKINKFKRELLDNISDERAQKERFGIKMDIEPPKDGESIVPWENQEEVFDLEEEPDDELDLDAMLGELDSEEDQNDGSNENDIAILKDSKKVDIDPEFNELDNDFDVLSSHLEENLEKVLDDNSISLDDAINFDLDNNADSLQNLDIENDLDSDLLNSDESIDNEIDANNLSQESLNDSNDDFDLENMISGLKESDETNNRLEMPYSDESFSNENSENLSDGEEDNWSNLSDDFEFLENDQKEPLGKHNFKINYPLFFKHLDSYPRNLRIAIAEALMLENVSRYKIEALIDLVEQNKKGLKFIAKFVGDIVGRSVKLPVMYYKAEECSKLEKKFSYRLSKALTPIFKIASLFVILTFLSFYFLVDVMFFYIASDRKYKEGISYIYENKRELAKAIFRDAYYMKPNKKWFLTYAKVFEDVRDFDSAEEKYEELFTIDPFSVGASKRRRKNFDRDGYISYAFMKMRLGEYADANAILDEVISYSIYDYEALMAKGDNYFQWAQRDPAYYKDSINNYTILLSKYGHKKEILFKLFNAYIEAGAEREAEDVNAFIKVNKELDIDEVVYTKYAKKLIDKYVEFTVYNKRINALSRNLKYFSAQMNLLNKEFSSFKAGNGKSISNALNDINLNSEIEYILRRILFKNPDYDKALFESGRYFYYMGDLKKSEGYLLTALNSFRQEDSIENSSEKIVAYRILSDIYERNNDALKASNIVSLALNEYDFYKKNGLVKSSRELALIYEKQGDILRTLNGFKSAISSYEMAINEGVNSPDVYYKLALLNYKENNYKDALTYLFRVQNMSGFANSNKVLNSIASVLYKMGDFEAARSYYLRVLQNLESEKSSILSFKPQGNDHHKALLIKEIEIYNNLGVVEIRASLGDRIESGVVRNNNLFDSGIANLTESSRIFDILNRDDDMVKSVKKDLASLNLRGIFKNDFIGSKILFYDNLADNL
ncbi:periplasmic flagellar collar protein FlcA [Borrelia turicatae]|uniref:periplasmic flagellar collar protein FlcA n=1 Tax=Borrelia turicatae TaxID=142 RepID=UPI002ED5D9DE